MKVSKPQTIHQFKRINDLDQILSTVRRGIFFSYEEDVGCYSSIDCRRSLLRFNNFLFLLFGNAIDCNENEISSFNEEIRTDQNTKPHTAVKWTSYQTSLSRYAADCRCSNVGSIEQHCWLFVVLTNTAPFNWLNTKDGHTLRGLRYHYLVH